MRVIYDTTEDCTKCVYNKSHICTKLMKYLFDICFERDCPLPELSDVEEFTRYVTSSKSLECCGNCKHWERWHYNKSLNNDVGSCEEHGMNLATGLVCDKFEMAGD